MKKLVVALGAALVGIVANAAAVQWTTTGMTASPETSLAAGWAFYVLDGSTYDTFSGLKASEIASFAADNFVAKGTTAPARGGAINATVTGGNYAANEAVSSYMVFFDNSEASAAKYYAYTAVANTTIAAGGQQGGIGFGTFTAATAQTGGWHSMAVPEPTSGLLLLLGMAGIALKRKHA